MIGAWHEMRRPLVTCKYSLNHSNGFPLISSLCVRVNCEMFAGPAEYPIEQKMDSWLMDKSLERTWPEKKSIKRFGP